MRRTATQPFLFLLFIGTTLLFAIPISVQAQQKLIKNLVIRTDTNVFQLTKDTITFQGAPQLYFTYQNENEVAQIDIEPVPMAGIKSVRLLPNEAYALSDTILWMEQEGVFRFNVRFNDLTNTGFLRLNLEFRTDSSHAMRIRTIRLLPVHPTVLAFYPDDNELYIGEEKIFELVTNNIDNIKIQNTWTEGRDIDYRMSRIDKRLRLHLLPNKLGRNQKIELQLQTIRPFVTQSGKLSYNLPTITKHFDVKSSRLRFLSIDEKEFTLSDVSKRGIEVQIEGRRSLVINKTYRIEDREDPGGPLIAELFTRRSLSNDQVLCDLRLFNFHRKSDGYLYIKDGDKALFITNFSITPKTTINKITLQTEGGDPTTNLKIRPGDKVEVKIMGEALHKANFHFDEVLKTGTDSLLRNENISVHRFKVPLDYSKSAIDIYNGAQLTGYSIKVQEYQRPRKFDWLTINYGDDDKPVNKLNKPILYDQTIKDIVVGFDQNKIDSKQMLYGTQFFDIKITVRDDKNKLIEIKEIENVQVCPGEDSPRFLFYDSKKCRQEPINFNYYLSQKTYGWQGWTNAEIVFSHRKNKYGGDGFSHKVDLVFQRHYNFDIDLSFPAGLIIKRAEEEGFGNLSGISMAMIAQFSFYQPDKINQFRPYRIGAGFLALNAFNFNENANGRDVGVVILGSVYPTRRDVKLTFPLYVGAGYLLQDEKWFWLLGPGIRIRI